MSTPTHRNTAPRAGDPVDHRLARLLDAPFLARIVPHLPPETLHKLVQHCGLEACGDLVTATTPSQLTSLLDLDLWRQPQAGRSEEFDVDRFGEWLDVLVDTGDSVAARTVAALDPHLVVTGLSRYLRVFDPGTFEPTESSDDELIERHERMNSETAGDVLECEVGGYLVRAYRTDAWDAIVALLTTLETEHPHYFRAVMEKCRSLSNSRPEVDGLDDLLMAPEQHLYDVAAERARRRSRLGYASPDDARAFLQMARQPSAKSLPPRGAQPTSPSGSPVSRVANPIAAAYFREADEAPDSTPDEASGTGAENRLRLDPADLPDGDDGTTSVAEVMDLLREAGVMPEQPRALLTAAGNAEDGPSVPVLRRLMTGLTHDGSAHSARTREFAFLANVLAAGCSVQSRPFTTQEAADAAAAVCNLGLECWPARWPEGASSQSVRPAQPPETFLVNHDLVTAFEVGWSVLYQDVTLFVTDQLLALTATLGDHDSDLRAEVRAFRRTLREQRQAGTPWRARKAAEFLAALDPTAWVSLLGLLDECPIMPAALTAVLERRRSSVSQTAFTFISSTAQLGDIRLFMRALPGLLAA